MLINMDHLLQNDEGMCWLNITKFIDVLAVWVTLTADVDVAQIEMMWDRLCTKCLPPSVEHFKKWGNIAVLWILFILLHVKYMQWKWE